MDEPRIQPELAEVERRLCLTCGARIDRGELCAICAAEAQSVDRVVLVSPRVWVEPDDLLSV